MPEALKTSDPAYWMLEKGRADKAAHRKGWVTPTHVACALFNLWRLLAGWY